jgi:hypothetical protein
MTFDEILAPRKLGKFYLYDSESPATRLMKVLKRLVDEKGFEVPTEKTGDPVLEACAGMLDLRDPEAIGELVARFYTEDEGERGPAITLRAFTKTENDRLREQCKQTPRVLDQKTAQWSGGEPDSEDYALMRLAAAIVEPEVPGASLREKAIWISENLTPLQIQDLIVASMALDRFDLRRIEEKVKN